MTLARSQVVERVLKHERVIREQATFFRLDPVLVMAMVCQESAGNTFAIRVERGFFRRYFNGLVALVKRTVSKRDDHWMQFPDVFSASYGLMQVMYPVALELGTVLEYPTQLCDPEIGVHNGCKKFRKGLPVGLLVAGMSATAVAAHQEESLRSALLRYNGGGDKTYPDKIFAWRRDVEAVLGQRVNP